MAPLMSRYFCTVTRLTWLLTLLAGAVLAQTPFVPTSATLPTAQVDATFPNTTGYTIRRVCVNTTCDDGQTRDHAATLAGLQAAIDAAATACSTAGSDIRIEKGASIDVATDNPIILKTSTCGSPPTKWIIVRTMDFANLPATGTRVCTSQSNAPPDCTVHRAVMPTLNVPNGVASNTNLFDAQSNADGYRLVGLRMLNSDNDARTFLHTCPDNICTTTVAADVPNGIIVDRSIMEPSADSIESGFGLILEGANIAVVDSVIMNIWDNTHVPGESKAVSISGSGKCVGPILIRNNFLEAAGVPIFIGGATPKFNSVVCSDITIRRNHLFRRTAWQNTTGDANPGHRKKNSFEVKEGIRYLVEGNIVQNNWMTGQGQQAQGFVVKLDLSTINAPWATTQHVTLRWNKVLNHEGYCMDMGLVPTLGGTATNAEGIWPTHYTVHDILCDGVSNGNLGVPIAGFMGLGNCNTCNQTGTDRIAKNIFLSHLTVIATNRVPGATPKAGWHLEVAGTGVDSTFTRCTDSFASHDNIFPMAREGQTATDGGNTCIINSSSLPNQSWSHDYDSHHKNLMTNAGATACTESTLSARPWAVNEAGCTGDQGANFTTWSAANIGTGSNNYTLLNTSPGFQAASDASARTAAGLSTNVGVDIANLNNETCGTLSGDWSCFAQGGSNNTSGLKGVSKMKGAAKIK